MVASAEQVRRKETTARSSRWPVGESAQFRKSVDRFPAPAARPPLSSVPSAVRNRVLFIGRGSLLSEHRADAHGSTRLVTNGTGSVVATMNYDAFGNALGFDASTALTTYLYSSMPFDAASGNYYDHARFFDPGTGSLTQSDYGYTGSLANPMTGLPYVYGGGDPINLLDLNGHGFTLAGTLSVLSDLSLEIATQIQVYPEALVAATRLLAVVNLVSFVSDPQAYEQSFISAGGNPTEAFATLLDDMNSVGRDALVEWAQAEGAAQTNLAPGGGLLAHEEAFGGHLIERHVGMTLQNLEQRLAGDTRLNAASSFSNQQAAEKAISEAINANQIGIQRWLASSPGPTSVFVENYNAGRQVRYYLPQGGNALVPATGVRIVLLPSAASPVGYYILTGYPIP